MHVLQAHAVNPWSEREEDQHRKGVASEHNSHQRISDDLRLEEELALICSTRKRKIRRTLDKTECSDTNCLIQGALLTITYVLIAIHRIREGYIAGYYKAKAKNTVPDGK